MRLAVLLFLAGVAAAASADAPPESYRTALELVHAFSGAGDELRRARGLARQLAQSHPDKGYAEVIEAEMLSTWNLNMAGGPPELYQRIMGLTDEALRTNPALAEAHVARARALIRVANYDAATQALDAALKLDPGLSGALFLRGENHRRQGQVAGAETWYLKFIEATPSRARKSNGYYWLALAYQGAAWRDARQWQAYVAKARGAYEKMIALDPDGAWKNVNFAIFLNNQGEDFAAAERYARKALDIMDFPMARYHLAAARYQQLLADVPDAGLKQAAALVAESSGVSLGEAMTFAERSSSYSPMLGRLGKLQQRLAQAAR
jgi:Tfp pilus assembly protein PilF